MTPMSPEILNALTVGNGRCRCEPSLKPPLLSVIAMPTAELPRAYVGSATWDLPQRTH